MMKDVVILICDENGNIRREHVTITTEKQIERVHMGAFSFSCLNVQLRTAQTKQTLTRFKYKYINDLAEEQSPKLRRPATDPQLLGAGRDEQIMNKL